MKNDFFGFRVGNRKRTDARGVAGSLEAPDLFGAAMISENYALEQLVAEQIVALRRGGVWREPRAGYRYLVVGVYRSSERAGHRS